MLSVIIIIIVVIVVVTTKINYDNIPLLMF